MNICIIIPCHNESHSIQDIVGKVRTKDLDVLVIDDGSSDGSGEIAQEAGADVIFNQEKCGKGCSLQKGFKYAMQRNYDAVITMDGDGQHAPEDLDQFLKKAQEDPQSVIVGSRMDDAKTMPIVRLLTNKTMSSLISMACKQKIPDTQCGYRYISCEALKKINITTNDFEIETEVLMRASKNGFKVYSVPIKTIYQNEKSKINPFKDTLRFIKYFTKEIFNPSN